MKIHAIPLKDILLSGEDFDAFFFTFPLHTGLLKDSIRKLGLLHPVCLREHARGWQIVFGARRILACHELGWLDIPAQTLTAKSCSVEKALEISLAENTPHRRLNPMEQARALHKFHTLANWDISRLVAELAPQLGLPPSIEVVRNYLSLLRLEPDIQMAVAEGNLSPAHAFLLAPLNPPERIAIFNEIILTCLPSLSESREIIETLLDLKITLKKGIAESLGETYLSGILKSPLKNPREKCHLLRNALRRMRYPHLSRLEDEFAQILSALSLKNNIHVRHAPHFEGNYLDFDLRARTPRELEETVQHLSAVYANGGFRKLFDLVKCEA